MEPGIVMRRYDCRKPCPEARSSDTAHVEAPWGTCRPYGQKYSQNRPLTPQYRKGNSPKVIWGWFYRYMKVWGADSDFLLIDLSVRRKSSGISSQPLRSLKM